MARNRNIDRSDNFKTPDWFYNGLDLLYGFDFDPCPYNENEILPQNDGLLIPWGKRNFINPPYSRPLKDKFIQRAYLESLKGNLCVLLIPAATDTAIFHDVILPFGKVEFLRGRIKFEKKQPDGSFKATGSNGMSALMLVIFEPKN
jgi:hypothetical protein